ncbi:MAG TPA: TIGR03067 domain-containing protein [Isosphaeraceae bacterium]|nr:TIGR03067 domain-containing protein [Isosphaeraceae bacterium]
MKGYTRLAIAACLLIAADVPKSDQDRLQGSWRCVSLEDEGEKAPPKLINSLKISFDKRNFQWGMPGDFDRGTFKVDSTKTPKTIDFTFSEGGHTGLGIYQVGDDTLKLCVGDKRPKDFVSRPSTACSLWILKRDKTGL